MFVTIINKFYCFFFSAGPLSFYESGQTQCSTTCPDTQKFSFVPGKTYEYRYESDALTSIPGATEESSALHMSATVRLETLSTCEMALSVSTHTIKSQLYNSNTPAGTFLFVFGNNTCHYSPQ